MKFCKSFIAIILIGLSIILSSCGDCNQIAEGVIVDEKTNQPIDSAYVQNILKAYDNTYSDSLGNFELHSISGGLFKCPPISVIIKKDGYRPVTLKMESGIKDTVKLLHL